MEDTHNVEVPSATDNPHNKQPPPFPTLSSHQHHSVEPAATFREPENQQPESEIEDGEKDYVHMCMSNIVNLPSLCTQTRCELMDTFQ